MDNFHSDQLSFLKALVFCYSWENPSPFHCILGAACLQLHKRYHLPSMDALAKALRACGKFIWVLTYFCSSTEMIVLAPGLELPVQQITGVCRVCLTQNECWTPTQLTICMLRNFSFPVLPSLVSKYPNMLPVICFCFSLKSLRGIFELLKIIWK